MIAKRQGLIQAARDRWHALDFVWKVVAGYVLLGLVLGAMGLTFVPD